MNPIKDEEEVFNFLISKYCAKSNQRDIIKRAKSPLINKICECYRLLQGHFIDGNCRDSMEEVNILFF